jgi:hypothetical protein
MRGKSIIEYSFQRGNIKRAVSISKYDYKKNYPGTMI